ncbi:phosphoglycerate mutase family protein [candidate division WWE3 bacterium]|uniref:Phosphoglycerate mutase family protein n=1 Tax=candidate division WWE3 bacterium TaxID=2053526 RepID=A0A955LVJ4_UNCKA|nr:phosphoglycerate mutase family protein [candidate division WWE3 bacterium]
MQELLFVRHLEDIDDLCTEGRDNPVSPSEVIYVKDIIEILIKHLGYYTDKKPAFITSGQKRTQQTADYIKKYLEEHFPSLASALIVDERTAGLYHGSYKKLPIKELNEVRDLAWEAYLTETFKNKNMYYRHGDPILLEEAETVRKYRYPEINGTFTKHGENQIEHSIRLYEFLIDLVNNYYGEEKNVVPIIIGHSLVAFRLFEISEVFRLGIDYQQGELMHKEFSVDLASVMDSVMSPPYTTKINVQPLMNNIQKLSLELEQLKENL